LPSIGRLSAKSGNSSHEKQRHEAEIRDSGKLTCAWLAVQHAVSVDESFLGLITMASTQHKIPKNIVPHPRYGATPIPSALIVPEKEIRVGYWGLLHAQIFPDTVLLADSSKQNYSLYPRKYYVDILRTCLTCRRPFIFFAREQRYWYETLGFYVDANCVHCPVCRRNMQTQKRRLRRYSDLLAKNKYTDEDLMHLVDDGTLLLDVGILRNLTRLGKLKNDAQKRIPDYKGTASLATALANIRRSQNTH
jgi:hypothetical protein